MGNVYEQRLQLLQSYLKDQQVEASMITSPINIYYFTGFFSDPHERFMALWVTKEGQTVLYVPSLDEESAAKASAVRTIIPIKDTDDPYERLKQECGASLKRVGIEKKIMSVFQGEKLKECFEGAAFLDVEDFIMTLRSKKSKEEIQLVRKAIEVVERVLAHGVSKVAPGVTELEITAEMEYQMKVLGAERPAFSTMVLSGKNSALPHGRPGNRKIESGEFLLFDLGVFVGGYCSDITRTFIVGVGSEKQQDIYETVRIAVEKAIDSVKAGDPIGKVDRAARDYIESQGYGQYFIHRVGHGLGLDVHEAPSIHSNNQTMMEPGLLFTIEPGIYIPEIGGVRIEDDIYIGEDGRAEVLTTYPKQLIHL